MAAAVYFIEGSGAGEPAIAAAGLAYALLPGGQWRQCHTGPGSAPGLACSHGVPGYYPEEQTWLEMPPGAGGRRWFGYSGSPPGPAELLRPDAIAGVEVELFDGRRWLVPRARVVDGGGYRSAVPAPLVWNGDTWARGRPRQRFERFEQIAEEFFERVFAGSKPGGGGVLTIAGAASLAVEVLAINYRLSPFEAGALGLFDSEGAAAVAVLKACVDWARIVEEPEGSKKNAP